MKKLLRLSFVVCGILLIAGCAVTPQDLVPRASEIPNAKGSALDGVYTLRAGSGSVTVRVANGKVVPTAGSLAGYAIAKGIARDKTNRKHIAFSCLTGSYNLSKGVFGWSPGRIEMVSPGKFVLFYGANDVTGLRGAKDTLVLVQPDNKRAMAGLQEEFAFLAADSDVDKLARFLGGDGNEVYAQRARAKIRELALDVHAEQATRLKAIGRITDEKLLARIAIHGEDSAVQKAAITTIRDGGLLAEIATSQIDAGLRQQAVGRLKGTKALITLALVSTQPDLVADIGPLLPADAASLVGSKAKSAELRSWARIEQARDPRELAQLCIDARQAWLARIAARKLPHSEPKLLLRVLRDAKTDAARSVVVRALPLPKSLTLDAHHRIVWQDARALIVRQIINTPGESRQAQAVSLLARYVDGNDAKGLSVNLTLDNVSAYLLWTSQNKILSSVGDTFLAKSLAADINPMGTIAALGKMTVRHSSFDQNGRMKGDMEVTSGKYWVNGLFGQLAVFTVGSQKACELAYIFARTDVFFAKAKPTMWVLATHDGGIVKLVFSKPGPEGKLLKIEVNIL